VAGQVFPIEHCAGLKRIPYCLAFLSSCLDIAQKVSFPSRHNPHNTAFHIRMISLVVRRKKAGVFHLFRPSLPPRKTIAF
jgi:hypothetical protein